MENTSLNNVNAKQNMVRLNLAKQSLEMEKVDLMKKVDELEAQMTSKAEVKGLNSSSNSLGGLGKLQLEEFLRKSKARMDGSAENSVR